MIRRIVPTILLRGAVAVKGRAFSADRPLGPAVAQARLHEARGVDELVLLDVAATPEGRGPDLAAVRAVADVLFTPFAAGGGVRSVADAKALLHCGADKVVVGAAARARPALLGELAARLGRQSVVATVDDRGDLAASVAWAVAAADAGAGELLVQSVARDGTLAGYDLDLVRAVATAVAVPVVASGGARGYDDLHAALAAGASAVAAGALWAFTSATPRGAAAYLRARGWPVRIEETACRGSR